MMDVQYMCLPRVKIIGCEPMMMWVRISIKLVDEKLMNNYIDKCEH